MTILRALWPTLAVTCLLASAGATAGQQIPPHTPGTICFTPKFWCWAQPPGRPGGNCACRTSSGWVPGRLG